MSWPLALVLVLVGGGAGAAVGRLLAGRRSGPVTTTVAGYPVEAVLGSGSTSTVYLGRDPRGRQVAVKVLYRLGDEDQAATRARVDREISALSAVSSSHLPTLLAVADDPAGVAIVTDFVAGATLTQVLVRNGRLAAPAAAAVLEGALLGLADLHAAGVVHRDVKPDNIIVTGRGQSRIVDFGLARPAGPGPTRALEGSPAYMSPEQATGGALDARSDVWSCGAVLFEALHGSRQAALHDDAGTGPGRRAGEMLRQARVPEPLADLTSRALATDPAARPADAGELLAQLRDYADRAFGPDWRVGAGLGALAATVGARTLAQLRPQSAGAPAGAAQATRVPVMGPVVGAAAGILIAAGVTVPAALSASASPAGAPSASASTAATTAAPTLSAGTGSSPPAATATPTRQTPPVALNLTALMVPRIGTGGGFLASQPQTPATIGAVMTPLLLPAQLVKDGFVTGRYEFFSGFSSGTAYVYLFQLGSPALAGDWLHTAGASGLPAFSSTAVPGSSGAVFRGINWVEFVRGPVVAVVGASDPGAAALLRRVAAAQYAKLAAAVPG